MAYSLTCRVYYGDTDAGGVVYYANYLKYLERCRTEWLRQAGFDQSTLLAEHGIGFMVRRVEADYRRPAILDDQIDVSLTIEKLGGARIIFLQVVRRKNASAVHSNTATPAEVLLEARVEVACVHLASGKPTPIPLWLKNSLLALT